MPIEEILDSKKKIDQKEFESILRNQFENKELIDIIIKDAFHRQHKLSSHIIIDSKIFSYEMREKVVPLKSLDIKANLELLKAEYESLDKKCWNELFKKIPKKLIFHWDLIINENQKIIETILKKIKQLKIDVNLIKELEHEKNYLENILNLLEKLSYEEITNETMALFQDHLKLQKYSTDKNLLPTS